MSGTSGATPEFTLLEVGVFAYVGSPVTTFMRRQLLDLHLRRHRNSVWSSRAPRVGTEMCQLAS